MSAIFHFPWQLSWLIITSLSLSSSQVPIEEMTALHSLFLSTSGEQWHWSMSPYAGPVWDFTQDNTGHYIYNPCYSNTTTTTSSFDYPASTSSPTSGTSVSSSFRPQSTMEHTGNYSTASLIYSSNSNSNSNSNSYSSSTNDAVVNNSRDPSDSLVYSSTSSVVVNQTWQGVTCSHTPKQCSTQICHITGLLLASHQLSGPIPSTISGLSALQSLHLDDNHVTGQIPAEIADLASLESLSFYVNALTGTIPPELGQLKNLTLLALDVNLFTGTIPIEICNFSKLAYMYIGQSFITGTIPSEIGKLTSLEELTFHSTDLTGIIPNEVGKLTLLQELTFYENSLTGTLPSEVGLLTSLELMSFSINYLTGTIPPSLGNLHVIGLFFFYRNMVTGTIPTSLGKLTAVEVIDLSDAKLTGTIPNELFDLTKLKELALYSNFLSGTISDSIGQLVLLDELLLQDNMFEGTLPSTISQMRNIKSIFLRNNRLVGELNVFDYTSQTMLATIDVSNNRLTGSISADTFMLPHLHVLSLSVNCFVEELPQTLCLAENVEVLALNGLRASEGCSNSIKVPIFGVRLFNTIGGSIPHCVFTLRNLTTLHLTDNGLTGSLVTFKSTASSLLDISFSHNQLSGTIPPEYFNVSTLDLSFNQLSGEYQGHYQYSSSVNISLENNRISGQLPVEKLEEITAGRVAILRGNMFSCNSIPSTDENANDYVCGSWNLNTSLIVFSCVIGVAALVIGLAWISTTLVMSVDGRLCKLVNAVHQKGLVLWHYATIMERIESSDPNLDPTIRTIAQLSGSFLQVVYQALCLLALILMGSFVLYLMKLLDSGREYSTHSHTYSWFWTQAFMRGQAPAGVLLGVWMITIFSCFYRIVLHPSLNRSSNKISLPFHQKKEASCDKNDERPRFAQVALAFIFNAFITITVNTAYIYFTQQDLGASIHFSIQLGLSIFRLVYVAVAFPALSRSVQDAVDNIRFRFILLTFNNLLIPCVVTALTSDLCFQGLIIPADAISTIYSYETCGWYEINEAGVMYCAEYGREYVSSAAAVPAFSYNHQCATVVLTAYIPVFLLSFAIQLILPFVVMECLQYLPLKSLGRGARNMFHGVLWPEYWVGGREDFSGVDIMLKIKTIYCNDIFNNLMLLLTYGLCSPVLAVGIVCVIAVKMYLWVILIGRFTVSMLHHNQGDLSLVNSASPVEQTATYLTTLSELFSTNQNEVVKFPQYLALETLSLAYIPLDAALAGSFWRLVWCSGVFIGLLCWDMAADDVGWLRSLWVPCTPILFLISLRLTAVFSLHDLCGQHSDRGLSDIQLSASTMRDSNLSSNPMHSNAEKL